MPRENCDPKCPRYGSVLTSPCMCGTGPKPARIMVVGKDPSQKDDKRGKPFAGLPGRLLDELLMLNGINREEIYISNAVKCGTPGEDKEPGKKEVKFCRTHLVNEINEVKPEWIITLGGTALEAVTGRTGITKIQNTVLDCPEFGCKVLPMVHPSFVLRDPGNRKFIDKGFEILQDELSGYNQTKKKGEYLAAKTVEQAMKILNKLDTVPAYAVDIETSDINFLKSEILCITFSWKDQLGTLIPWSLVQDSAEVSSKLKSVLASKKLKIGQNIKFDVEHLMKKGYPMRGPFFDTMVAHGLIDDNAPENGLDALVLRYTDMGEYWADLEKFKKEYCKENGIKDGEFSYKLVPTEILHPYAMKDADATYRLYTLFLQKLKEENQYDFFVNHSMAFLPRLIEMEYRGIKVNRENILSIKVKEEAELKELEAQIVVDENVIAYEKYKTAKLIDKGMAKLKHHWQESKTLSTRYPDFDDYAKTRCIEDKVDTKFNMSSPIQLRELFFDMLKLKTIKETKTKKPSTDKDVMEIIATEYDIPLASLMDRHRKKEKFIEQFLTPLYEKSVTDGRIHTNYIQADVITGRLCVSGDTLIETPQGRTPINKILPGRGTKVLTHAGRYRNVLNKFYKGKEQMYEVLLDGGQKIRCTKGHRFLTNNGWKSLNDIRNERIGSVYTLNSDKCGEVQKLWKDSGDSLRGKFCTSGPDRASVVQRGTRQVWDTSENNGSIKSRISGEVRKGDGSSPEVPLFLRPAGEQARTKRQTGRFGSQRSVGRVHQQKNDFVSHSAATGNKRVVCAGEYQVPQPSVLGQILGTSPSFGRSRFLVARKAGNLLPGHNSKGGRLLQGPSQVLPGVVRVIPARKRDGMVYQRAQQTSRLLRMQEEGTQRSHMLEYQQERTGAVHGVNGAQHTAHTAVSVGQGKELLDRFCVSGNKCTSRSGRSVSQEECDHTKVGQKENENCSGIGVHSFKVYGRGSDERHSPCTGLYTKSTIQGVTPCGVLDVWDIEVEEDHSYVSDGGFINHNSSRNPNLQNLPRDAIELKSCFLADEGFVFIKADLAQAEFRVWAACSNDTDMIRDIEAGLDIHRRTASSVFGIDEDKVTGVQRNIAKRGTFGMMYGIGSKKLARQFKISLDQAGSINRIFAAKYPVAANWIHDLVRQARADGYVTSWFGRKRRVPHIYSDDQNMKAKAERQAMNSPIQAQASDMNNHYMVNIIRELRHRGIGCHPVMTTHDENVIAVAPADVHASVKIIQSVVHNSVVGFNCRMDTECKVGSSVGGAKIYEDQGT